MGSWTYQMILLVLIGAAVFVAGTVSLKNCLRRKRPGAVFKGKVLDVKLVTKRDKEDRLIQYYYELMIQYRQNNRTFRCKINSTREYKQEEELELIQNGDKIMPVSSETISFDSAIAMILAGMALAVFPVAYRNAGDKAGSVLLALLLFAVGWILFSSFIKDRKRYLIEIEGKITDVLYYRRGENKKLIKASESYYPLIRYKIYDKEKTFLSSYNSSLKTAYKTGKPVKLYYDEKTKSLAEKKASPLLVVAAVILWCIAVIGIVSILG